MGILEQKILRFDGGIADSSREPDLTKAAMIKHFDIFNSPFKLVPYRSTVSDTMPTSPQDVIDPFHYTFSSNGKVYAFAKIVGTSNFAIVKKDAPSDTTWIAVADITDTRITGCFIEWQSAFWFFGSTNKLYKHTLAGVSSSVATLGATVTTAAQGILGGDNNLYVFYNNKVVKVNASGVATDNIGPTLPSDMRITSVALWGNYIAIGMAFGTSATAVPAGPSRVFLWDKVSTTTVSEVIDWGEGALMVLGNVEGSLVGVSDKYLSDSSGLTRGSMVIRKWNGGSSIIVKEIVANQNVTLGRFLNDSVVKNNKLYWVASVPFNQSTSTESTFHLGIWVYGRKNINSDFALSLDFIEEAVDTANFKIVSFGSAGNYFFLNHSNAGATTRIDNAATFDFDSIYETVILNGGDSSRKKKLVGVKVMFEPLPAAATITIKYRKDEESSYTTIGSESADNAISHASINIESSGANLPTYKELQFRIESTGGGVITGLMYRYEEIDDDKF